MSHKSDPKNKEVLDDEKRRGTLNAEGTLLKLGLKERYFSRYWMWCRIL